MKADVVLRDLDRRQVEAFYKAAMLGLRRLDDRARPPRRFDAEADARWTQFQGNLTWAHRVDLLLRDASATFGAAFHAGAVFGLPGLAADEPFGPGWTSLRPQQARDLWNEVKKAKPIEPKDLVAAWAKLLGIVAPGTATLKRPTPAEQIVAVGPTAAWKVFESFMGQTALDWSTSVHVMAASPSGRQFGGLLAVVDPAPGATRLLATGGAPARADRIVVGPQLEPDEKTAVAALRATFPSAGFVELT